MPSNYDKIARIYDMLSRIVFGNSIARAQVYLLLYIPNGSRILIAGGGTGWILEKMTRLYPSGLTIDYVESSAQMIALSEKRDCGDNTVNFINLPVEDFKNKSQYDVIFTPFLFDNFKPDKAGLVFDRLQPMLKNKGLWLHADFVYSEGSGRWWQRILLRIMYFFFRITCDIETNELVDMDGCFRLALRKICTAYFYFDFIQAIVYQKTED